MGSARRVRLGCHRRWSHGGARRRGHGARLHPPPGPPEHIVGVAVPVDGEPAARRDARQPVGHLPGGNPFLYLQPEQPGLPGLLIVPAAAAGPEADTTVSLGSPPAPDQDRWFASASYLGTKIVNQLIAEEQNPALNLGFGPHSTTRRSAPIALPGVHDRREPRPAPRVEPGEPQRRARLHNAVHGQVPALQRHAAQHALDLGSYVNLNANYTLSKCEAVSPIGVC